MKNAAKQESKAKTVATGCFPINGGDRELFQVSEGTSASDALDMASVMLAAALPLVYEMAHDLDSNRGHGAAYLLEMIKGVLDSVALGLNDPPP